MKKWVTIAGALMVCAVLIFTREKQPQWQVSRVTERELSRKIEAVGTVVPAQTCVLMPQIAGSVKQVFVQQGDHVGKGQAVAEVELLPEVAAEYLVRLQNAELDEIAVQERLRTLCTVTAPQEGEVMQWNVYEGMQTAPGSALGCVISSEVRIAAPVPESLREELFEGQKVIILRGDTETDGEITYIAPDEQGVGQYSVYIAPTGSARGLEAGMQVDVEVLIETSSGPSVPLQALQPDGTVICRMEDGVAAVPVQTGLCTETYAQLLSGPPVGTEVVIGKGE